MTYVGNNGIFKHRVWVSPEAKAFLRQSHHKFRRVGGLMVNDAAFQLREELFRSLEARLMFRRPGFVRRQLRVAKAAIGRSNPVAVVGSVYSDNRKFEGWRAQQFGAKADRTRVPTLLARGGAKQRVMQKRARLVKGRDIPTAQEVVGKSSPGAVIALMRILARRGDRRPFIIFPGEHPSFRGGLYELRGRKDKRDRKARLRLLQSFESSRTQPRRIDWVNPAWRAFQRSASPRAMFRKAMNKVNFWDAIKPR